MPVFECGNSKISLPEGNSYVCVASRDGAEWKVVQYLCNTRLIEGEEYKVSCKHGSLVVEPSNPSDPLSSPQS